MLLIICPGIISDVWFPLSETSMASSISAGAFAMGNDAVFEEAGENLQITTN